MATVGVLILCAVLGSAFASPIADCTDFTGGVVKINSVDVPGCTTAPCVVKRGTNATVTINFTPSIQEKDITNQVYGIIAGQKVPFPLSENDACKLGAKCPMPANEMETEKVTIQILKIYPPITLIAEWELFDAEGTEQGCFLIQIKIEN